MKKDEVLRLRISKQDKQLFSKAAKKKQVSLANWLIQAGLTVLGMHAMQTKAKKDIKKLDKYVPTSTKGNDVRGTKIVATPENVDTIAHEPIETNKYKVVKVKLDESGTSYNIKKVKPFVCRLKKK